MGLWASMNQYGDIMEKTLEQQIADDDIFFCHMPWTMVYSEVTGNWQTCCHGKEQFVMNVANTSPIEWMQSDIQQALRDEMLDPEQYDGPTITEVCRRCKKEEQLYGESRRLRKNRSAGIGEFRSEPFKDDLLQSVQLYKSSGVYEFDNRILETQVKVFGMECNLDCHMCHPRHSTTRQRTQLRDGLISRDIYGNLDNVREYTDRVMAVEESAPDALDQLLELAPYTYNVKIIGGEPLMMVKQYEYLQRLIDTGHSKHIHIKYQTNFTKLGHGKHKVIDFVPHFERFTFTASLDSMGDAIEYCRRRTVWSDIVENCNIVKQFPNAKVDINAVMGFLSILRFYDLLEWKDTSGLVDKHLSCYALEYPPNLQVRNLPEKIKQSLIPKYEGYPYIQEMLRQESDSFGTPDALQKTFRYLLDQDEYYKGTKYEKNLFEVFPELEEFYDPDHPVHKKIHIKQL